MRRLIAISAVLFVSSLGSSWAHEGHDHGKHKVMGTVKAVHADTNHVEVTLKDNTTSVFYVDASTKYRRGSTALKLADLKPGDRVVVGAKKDGDKVTAVEVKVSGGTEAPHGAETPHKH